MKKHLAVVISGPSGVGKGETVKGLFARDKNHELVLSVSCTTRPPREGEIEGKSYFFITQQQFDEIVQNNGFLEYDPHFGGSYGTPRAFVEEKIQSQDVIFEVDVNGALHIKEQYPDAITVLIMPPSMQELERRLRGRGTETEEKIQKRLARAQYELSRRDEFDYVVINDTLAQTIEQVEQIIKQAKTDKDQRS